MQFLDDALQDRLVCSLKNDTTQKWLLLEVDLTLAKAVQIASNMELAEKQSLQFHMTRPGAICHVHVYPVIIAIPRTICFRSVRVRTQWCVFGVRKRTHCKSLSGEGAVGICSR